MARRIFSGGWRRSNLARSPYPTKLCHFCNLASIIVPPHPEEEQTSSTPPPSESSLTLSTGSESNWFCSRCHCWNRFDEKEEGGMKSWESRMGDESVNNSVRYTSSTSNSILDRKSIFCHTCQMNQTLVLSMISNYEEGDTQRFKIWRDDLEKRYPPICIDCREVVEDQLRTSDKRARALIWNDLLQRRHTRQPANSSSSIDTHQSDSNSHSRNVTARSKVDWIWYIGALCFLASCMSEIVVLFCVLFHSSLPVIQISSMFLQCFSSKWDPSIPRQVQFTTSNPGTIQLKIQGFEIWQMMQWIVTIIRLFHSCQSYLSHNNNRYQIWISVISILLQFILCSIGYRAIKIHLPPRVSLKSRESTRSSLEVQRSGPDLIHLSLQDDKPEDQKNPNARRNEDDGEEEPEEEEDAVDDSMDWSPTLPARGFSSNNDNKSFSYTFGPRRFFEPVNDTGLEDLLRRNLGLQDSFDDDNDRVPMDLDMPTDGNAKISQRRYIHFAIAFSIVALIIALYFNEQDEKNFIGFIPSKFYNTSVLIHFYRSLSSFLQPIRQWWSSAFAIARQRTPHQALWRPSFEEVSNAE